MMRLSAIIGLPVRTAAGHTLGRLHEVRAVNGRVSEFVYGTAGLFERLTGRAQRTTLPWSRVKAVHADGIELN
jgi:sporulation protein YlmC with PRC-barrel domain